jgi:hypothetical protein
MAERTTVTNTVQIGLESTAGTAVAASKLFASMEFATDPKFQGKLFRPAGRKYGSFVVPGREWVEAKLSGTPTYGEIVYPLASVLKKVTPTADGTLPKLWTFAPALSAEDVVATYTVEQGSSVRAHKWAYGLVTEYGLKFTKDEVTQDGVMLGRALTDAVTMTGSPTAIETVPTVIAGPQVDFGYAANFAGLGSMTALTRVMSVEWKVSSRFKPAFFIDSSTNSWAVHVETVPKVQLKVTLEADATGMGYLTQMRAGSTLYFRIKATGANIESAKPYSLTIDGAYQIAQEPGELKDQDGLVAIDWTFDAVYDVTAAKTIEVIVRNQVAAL